MILMASNTYVLASTRVANLMETPLKNSKMVYYSKETTTKALLLALVSLNRAISHILDKIRVANQRVLVFKSVKVKTTSANGRKVTRVVLASSWIICQELNMKVSSCRVNIVVMGN